MQREIVSFTQPAVFIDVVVVPHDSLALLWCDDSTGIVTEFAQVVSVATCALLVFLWNELDKVNGDC